MTKKQTLFSEILDKLRENVLPNIVSNLQKMGMKYVHITVDLRHSLCFFNHKGIDFPFNVNNGTIQKIKDERGEDIHILMFNIRFDGQISISENIFTAQNGLTTLGNTCILFDDFNEMFEGVRMENVFIFLLSRALTDKSKQLQAEITLVNTLLDDMTQINPRITREVLMEKNEKSK